ncbi:MAG TPA: FIST N-terminal domain-containing protein [Syntrophorhabdaceae bacterium]|nr:FIST N-terminal domain-containing protein [Syntrophorhabdaceae bacterium]
MAGSAGLVLAFGAASIFREQILLEEVKRFYPDACIFGCSTAGEIYGTHVLDGSLCITAIGFEHTQCRGARVKLSQSASSLEAGRDLAQALPPSVPSLTPGKTDELAHVFVLSDGLKVNGSDLVCGLTEQISEKVTITGGLAGDGDRFGETFVLCDGAPEKDVIAVLGLYGNRLRTGFGSLGGWDPFGPERIITRSDGNVLYELDGHSALELYKKYLGEHAKGLPATGLLFPLSLRTRTSENGVVRTILSVDEKKQTMTFAGNVPEGAYARMMKANFDRLIDGAVGAAQTSRQAIGDNAPDLAILISCVGRKLVLKQRVEEEVEGVRDILGDRAVMAGFYSYGEISPFAPGAKCELHNQTMTVTTFVEE